LEYVSVYQLKEQMDVVMMYALLID